MCFSELTAGIGYDYLRKVLDIMGMVSDKQEMQVSTAYALRIICFMTRYGQLLV